MRFAGPARQISGVSWHQRRHSEAALTAVAVLQAYLSSVYFYGRGLPVLSSVYLIMANDRRR
jgi:hypothetical protein